MTTTAEKERVWILEMNSSPLRVTKDEKTKKHKFRGLCAEFTDELNENNRLYDKGNYDEKVIHLQEKIKKRALCGELDHNEDFLVSMKNASHIITELKDLGKSYEIEIELIPGTIQGNNAIALAEAGVPLFISSRASGYIDKRGNVTLEKIYTYDLVSEPGFKNAELIPVNESINLNGGSGVKVKQFKNSQVRIYKWNDPEHKDNAQKSNLQINKQNVGNMAYATKDDILELKKQLAALANNGLRTVNESLQTPGKLKFNGIPVEMLNKVPKTDDVLTVDSVEFKVRNVENVDESVDTSPNFKLRGTYAYTMNLEGPDGLSKIGYVTKTGEFHIADVGVSRMSIQESGGNVDAKLQKAFEAIESKVNELVEAINATKMEQRMAVKYIDGLSKLLEVTINDHDKMVNFVNLLADHSDNSTVVMNKIIEQSDKLIKRANLLTESLNATQEYVNEHAAHSDNVVKVLNKLIQHSDKSTAHLNMLHNHADQLTNVVNMYESKIRKGANLTPASAKQTPATKINESKNVNQALDNTKKLLDNTKKILAKVKSNKTEENKAVIQAKYPFTKNFTEAEFELFSKLSENQKSYVLGKVGANARKANVMEALKDAAKQSDHLEFLSLMPKEKKAEWSLLPVHRKQSIIALFQSKNLRSKASIEAFWDNIDLKPSKAQGLVRRVDESLENKALEQTAMGYSAADMDAALGL